MERTATPKFGISGYVKLNIKLFLSGNLDALIWPLTKFEGSSSNSLDTARLQSLLQ